MGNTKISVLSKLSPLIEMIAGVLFVLLGIGIVDYFGKFPMPIKLIGIVGFAAVLYGGFLFATNLIIYSIYFFYLMLYDKESVNNPGAGNSLSYTITKQWKIGLGIVAAGTLYELSFFENTLGGVAMLIRAVWMALPLSLLVLIVLFRKVKSLRTTFALGYSVLVCTPMAVFLFVLLLFSITNRLGTYNLVTYTYTVNKKSTNIMYGTRWIWVTHRSTDERLEVSAPLYEQLNVGNKVLLKCSEGRWGYDYIQTMTKVD